MSKEKRSKETIMKPKDKAKAPKTADPLAVCEKPFSPESARLEDKDEPCEDGIQR
jgi:hypothetical protein